MNAISLFNEERPHKNAALLVKQFFPKDENYDYDVLLKVCTYIEKNKEHLLKNTPCIHSCYKVDCEIFVSLNKKIYVLVKHSEFEIGSGTFKTVYKGLDYFKEKLIAYFYFDHNIYIHSSKLKKLTSTGKKRLVDRHKQHKEIFEKEKHILNLLNAKKTPSGKSSHGITKILHSYETTEKITIIFKYYELGDLEKTLQKQKPSFKQKIQIAYDLICGLSCVHHNNVMHNDIKEENILVTIKSINKQKMLKTVLTDFGLSIQKANDDTDSKNPLNYTIGGSVIYYSPEKIRELISEEFHSRLTFKKAKQADIWALGCVLYTLFFGTPPWFTDMYKITRNGTISLFKKKEETAIHIEKSIITQFPEPKDRDTINHLIWEMLRPNGEDRITAEKALPRIKALLPPPIIPHLTLPQGYFSSDSIETPDSEDVSVNSRNSSRDTPKTARRRLQKSKSHHDLLAIPNDI